MKRKTITKLSITMLTLICTFVLMTTLFAYPTTPIGQILIENGMTYDGRNGARYDAHNYVHADFGKPVEYEKGNGGAGCFSGNLSGREHIDIKAIAGGNTWEWVPLYRVSRTGGYSNDVADSNAVANTIDINQLYYYANSVIGSAGRSISQREAGYIKQIMVNGFKSFSQPGDSAITIRENMEYFATQILIWEVQEGKRWTLELNGFRQEADTVGPNCYYWRDLYNQYLSIARQSDPGMPNYYEKILQKCVAYADTLSVETGTGWVNATPITTSAPTVYASYYHDVGQYQRGFRIPYNNLWGNEVGQFNYSGVRYLPDAGTGSARLEYGGDNSDGSCGWMYVASNSGKPISGYLEFSQNYDSTSYNPLGFMTGTSNIQRTRTIKYVLLSKYLFFIAL